MRISARFVASVASASLVGVTLLVASGCPGSLDDPSKFTGPDGGTTTGDCDVEGDLFPSRCGDSACHDPDGPAGSIDLVSPGIGERVAGVAAISGCAPGILADPANPTDSVIYVVLTPDSCTPFGQMPQNGTPFTDAELACVEQWIASLEPGGSTSSSGGMGGTPSTGGMGGAGGIGGAGGN